jgi:cell division protein ZapE
MRGQVLESPEKSILAPDESAGMDLRTLYRQSLTRRGFVADPAQLRAVEHLQKLYEEWVAYKARRRTRLRRLLIHPPLPRGAYLWGDVGRGKSFLMDSFYSVLPLVRKRRVHFHHFMREVHRELEALKGQPDPLAVLAQRLARRHRLICFDEFHVSDIADAMILGRLLPALTARGVVFCMTSNAHPDELYRDGLRRESFLPAIQHIKERLDVIPLDGAMDYRQLALERVKTYICPLGPEAEARLAEDFDRLRDVEDEYHPLDVEGRRIPYRRRAGGVVWFDFPALCGSPRSQADYLDLAMRFHTVLLSNVPRMSPAMANEARRLTWLVDVLYDHRVKLIVSAEVAPQRLYEEGVNSQEFRRTASRLLEMQTRAYLAQRIRR